MGAEDIWIAAICHAKAALKLKHTLHTRWSLVVATPKFSHRYSLIPQKSGN
jgi:hypothetical protein